MNTFTRDDIKKYKDDGFFIAKKLFSIDEITNISSWIDKLVVSEPRIGKDMYYYEDDLRRPGEKILNRLEKFCDYNKSAYKVSYSNCTNKEPHKYSAGFCFCIIIFGR